MGGSCSSSLSLPHETPKPPPFMRFGHSDVKDRVAALDVVSQSAADAAFTQEPFFSILNSSSVGSAFSMVTSGTRHNKTPSLQIPNFPKKRTRYLADATISLGGEVKRTRLDEQRQQQCTQSSNDTTPLRGPLSGQHPDFFTPQYQQSLEVMGCGMQVRGTRIPAAALESDICGDEPVSGLSSVGHMACDEAPNTRAGLQKHILRTSDNIGNTNSKRWLHSASTIPSPKSRLSNSAPRIHVHSESSSFSPQVPILQERADATPIQKQQRNRRGEAWKTRQGVCNPDSESQPYSGGNCALNTREARHAVGNPAYHTDLLCFERNKHGIFGASGVSCSDGQSVSAASTQGQLLCGFGRPQRSASTFREDTLGLLSGLDDRRTDLEFPFQRDGCTVSRVQCRSVRSEVSAHEGAVTGLVPSPDGLYLVSSGSDGLIRLWNAVSGNHCFVHMIMSIPRENPVHTSAQEPGRSRMSHTSAKIEKRMTTNRTDSIWGVQAAISKNGEYLIHGRGRVLCTFDIMSGAELQITAPGHTDDIVCVTWNEEKNEAYSGALDGSVLIYDAMCESIRNATIYAMRFS